GLRLDGARATREQGAARGQAARQEPGVALRRYRRRGARPGAAREGEAEAAQQARRRARPVPRLTSPAGAMNLLLLARGETDATGIVRLTGRRARELLRLPDLGAGRVLHAGVIDGPLGAAEVLEVDADAGTVTLGCRFAAEAPPRPEDTLLLAVPHPRTLLRCVEHAAALGFGRLVLLRTWRVAKSHL